jgi:hypothetical protein
MPVINSEYAELTLTVITGIIMMTVTVTILPVPVACTGLSNLPGPSGVHLKLKAVRAYAESGSESLPGISSDSETVVTVLPCPAAGLRHYV